MFRGEGKFLGPQEVSVNRKKLTAEKVIIATGSIPARPPIPGAQHAITSDELIHLKELPPRLVVIGGGFIGLEFGFALARACSKVTILQSGPQIVPAVDDEIRDALLAIAKETGITILADARVTRIAEGKTVEAEVRGRTERYSADQVLLATGRPSNMSAVDPHAAGIELEHSAVKVNDFLQSVSAPHVYAAGDASGKRHHTPVAWYEGLIAAHNPLKGNEHKVDFGVIPTAIFTIPAMAQVGLTEMEAQACGLNYNSSRMPFASNPAAGVRDETEGLVKVVYEEGTDRALGVHVIGSHAEDIIQIAAVGMRAGLKKWELGAMHYVFPTLGGAIFDAMAAG